MPQVMKRTAGILHRNAIQTLDKLATPANVVIADIATQGTFPQTTDYYGNVAAYNRWGTTVPGTKQTVKTATDGNNTHAIKLTVTQVPNADGYDLFMSADAQPKWVARITEAQRATGGRIETVGGPFVGDQDNEIATKIRAALTADPDVSAFFTVSGATNKVILTTKAKLANDATLNIAMADGTCVGLTAAPASANTTPGILAVKQKETATVDPASLITSDGHVRITVTAVGMGSSPKPILVDVANADDAAAIADKIRTVLTADPDVSAFFAVSGAGTDIILEALAAAANDGTMNIAQIDGASIGITAEAVSANTQAGDAPTLQIETATVNVGSLIVVDGYIRVVVTAVGMVGTPKSILVAVTATDDASAIAGKIRAALIADADVGDPITGFFTITGAGADVILTANVAAADDATLNLAQETGACAGITAEVASANTQAGAVPVLQIETATVNAGSLITLDGHVRVIVTAVGMTGSPKTLDVAVVAADDAAAIAGKIRTALVADADIGDPVTGFFTVTGAGSAIILTANVDAADDATMNLEQQDGACTGITAEAASANTQAGTLGQAQVETATVVAPGNITAAGWAKTVLTADGMTGSPITTQEWVALGDTAADVALALRNRMNLDARITAMFTVAGAGDDIVITRLVNAADDVTLNCTVENDTCTGITDDLASTDTTPGVAPVQQIETATINAASLVTLAGDADVVVTAAGMGGSPKTVRFAVALGDDEVAIASKARTALGLDADVAAFFTVSGAGADIILTALAAAANDATMNMASDNAAANGVVPVAASANTQAGVLGLVQIETATINPASLVTVAGDAQIIVTAAGMGGSPKTIRFLVDVADDPAAIAGKARTALGLDADVVAFFGVSGAGADIVLTALAEAANDATMNMATDNAGANGFVAVPASANTQAGDVGAFQIETATINPASLITAAGDAQLVVTAAGMGSSPKTIKFEVALADDPSAIAAKARAALLLDADVVAYFGVTGAGADIVLTRLAKVADDGTMNIASSNAAANGMVAVAASANTTAGVAGQNQVETATCLGAITTSGNASVIVTAVGMAGTPKTVLVPLSNVFAGAVPGDIEIYCVGTGLADNVAPFTVNNAYRPDNAAIVAVSCVGYSKAHVLHRLAVTDLRSIPSVSLVPFVSNQISANDWHQLAVQTPVILTAVGQSLERAFDLDVDGATGLKVLVDAIAGYDAAESIWIELS